MYSREPAGLHMKCPQPWLLSSFSFKHFIFTKKGEIQFDEDYCFDVSSNSPGANIELWKCHGFGGNQKFIHNGPVVCMTLK